MPGVTLYGALLAFLIALLAGPVVINYLRRLKLGQQIRKDGPQAHLRKTGTPTMGGVLIIAAGTISTLIWVPGHEDVRYCLLLTLGFAAIGFIDDFISVVARRPLGLKARQKLVAQVFLGIAVGLHAAAAPHVGTEILVPFTVQVLTLPFWSFIALVTITLVGTANAVNFTDGLDGLAAGTTAVAAVAYTLICLGLGKWQLAVFSASMAGACLGFTWFNAHPAQVIMGDTGAMGLGAALAALAVFTGTELFLVIIGGVFVLEAVSVILQVVYFRLTGGKRILRMSPLHHHFELSGWPETQVVFRFWILAFVFAILGLAGLAPAFGL